MKEDRGGGDAWLARLKGWARAAKRDVMALWIGARDPRTPLAAKLVAAAVAAYALSPIDLIPDFIPVVGYLDDLVLVPLGIALAVKLIPAALMAEFRIAAEGMERRVSPVGLIVILVLWAGGALLVLRAFWPRAAS